jgi:hypothetical protein
MGRGGSGMRSCAKLKRITLGKFLKILKRNRSLDSENILSRGGEGYHDYTDQHLYDSDEEDTTADL